MKRPFPRRGKARIVLVDDHPIVRERLAELINQQADLVVCGDCGDAAGCMELLGKTDVDLAIVDLSLKNGHGLDLIKDLRLREPGLPVLVLSMHDESIHAERALRAGARGYVTKEEATQTIMTAIRRVLAGDIYVSEKMSRQLVGQLIQGRRPIQAKELSARMTDREAEVFQMLAQGYSTRQIGDMLKIDIKTVETYYARLKEKVEVQSVEQLRQQAARWWPGKDIDPSVS